MMSFKRNKWYKLINSRNASSLSLKVQFFPAWSPITLHQTSDVVPLHHTATITRCRFCSQMNTYHLCIWITIHAYRPFVQHYKPTPWAGGRYAVPMHENTTRVHDENPLRLRWLPLPAYMTSEFWHNCCRETASAYTLRASCVFVGLYRPRLPRLRTGYRVTWRI